MSYVKSFSIKSDYNLNERRFYCNIVPTKLAIPVCFGNIKEVIIDTGGCILNACTVKCVVTLVVK